MFLYLDNWLFKDQSYEEVLSATWRMLALFLDLGPQLNVGKSILIPVQNMQFIGASLDSLAARAFLPTDRFLALSNPVKTIQMSHQTSIRNCLLGHIVACTSVTDHTVLHLCYLQGWLRTVYSCRHRLDKQVSVP